MILLPAGEMYGQPFQVESAPEVWEIPSFQGTVDSNKTIANYYCLKWSSISDALASINQLDGYGMSLFLVVKPQFDKIQSKAFLRSGGLRVGDSGVSVRGHFHPMKFKKDRPAIISMRFPFQNLPNGRKELILVDTTLFYIGEIIAFNRIISHKDRRKVETYLSLKYSIPTPTKHFELGDYLSRNKTNPYWSRNLDKDYQEEIVALGNLDTSAFEQTQTLAYLQDSIIFSLDSITPLGHMPTIAIDTGSYIILSKRKDLNSDDDCEEAPFIMEGWQMILRNWQSKAKHLIVHQIDRGAVRNRVDTILVYNGSDSLIIPGQLAEGRPFYKIPIDTLEQESYYRFSRFRSPCPVDSSLVEMNEPTEDSLTIFLDENLLPLQLEVQAVDNSETLSEEINYTNVAISNLKESQYIIRLTDSSGDLVQNYIVKMNGNDSNHSPLKISPSNNNQHSDVNQSENGLVIYPNPASSGELVKLEFYGFSSKPGKLLLFDGNGELLFRKNIDLIEPEIEFLAPKGAGYYTVVFLQENIIHTRKLIIQK